jgi:hypothetical protein
VSTGKLLGETIDVVEVAVRLVLVLLLQLSIVKVFIVKLGSLWRNCSSGGLEMLRRRD